jgi:RNA polymerase sigma-70 factor (ECF subfamily)
MEARGTLELDPELDELRAELLVVRCQCRDPEALRELVERYGPRLRYYLRKMLKRQDVEDAMQDVWLHTVRQLATLRDPRAFGPWIYRIARGRAVQEIRRHRPTEPLDESTVAAGADVADEAIESFDPADAAAIHAALDELGTVHREVLVLRFMEQMSYEQMASVLDAPVGTVRSRLHYAKQELRRVLLRRRRRQ